MPDPIASHPNVTDDGPVPSAPGDNTTLSAILEQYAQAGFSSSWEITDGGDLTCSTCGGTSSPESLSLHSVRRLEGASDPDDMAAVLAITCVRCGARGTAVIMYGPMSSAADADLLPRLRDERSDDVISPHGPPGDTVDDMLATSPPEVGEAAPDFAAFASTGAVLTLDTFLHKVPVVLMFSGEPGANEDLVASVDRDLAWFGARRVQVLVAAQAEAAALEAPRTDGRRIVPVLADPNGDLAARYIEVDDGFPATVVIGLDGSVVAHLHDRSASDHLDRVKQVVDELVSGVGNAAGA